MLEQDIKLVTDGTHEDFENIVGLHHGFAVGPLFFIIVMEETTSGEEEIHGTYCMLTI